MINFWICFRYTRASLLKGGFDTVEEAIKYLHSLPAHEQKEFNIRNKDRSEVVYQHFVKNAKYFTPQILAFYEIHFHKNGKCYVKIAKLNEDGTWVANNHKTVYNYDDSFELISFREYGLIPEL